MDFINAQKGFVQTSVFLGIIVGILVLGGTGYFAVNQYQNYQTEKIVKEKQAEEQGSALAEAKAEIDKLKTASEITAKEQSSLKKKVEQTSPKKEPSSGADNSYSKVPISSVVQLFCTQDANGVPDLNNASSGSGTFVSSGSGLILTNAHVVKNDNQSTCAVFMRDVKNSSKPKILFAKVLAIVINADAAFLQPQYLMTDEQGNLTDDLLEIPDNYPYPQKSNSCNETDIKLGSKLVVVGYPMVGGSSVTLTEGIVSGFSGDYIKTSAKIEKGNSGGAVFLVPSGCWVGIPSASAVGELESLGRILRWDK